MASTHQPRKRFRHLSPPSPSIVPMPSKNARLDLVPSLPMTPPDPDVYPAPAMDISPSSMDTVLHVIATERAALAHLERLYTTDAYARTSMEQAVDRIAHTIRGGGKLVVCGVGKSGKIAEKVVATMNSLGIHSCFLHPTEAMHGDLGLIRQNDVILFITFSGKTSELLDLLPHIPSTVSIIALTSHTRPSSCKLLATSNIRNGILLPAPVHENEQLSFGVPAPTTSTTAALAISDALALATARRLHTVPGKGPAEVFKGFHPGGAIGAAALALSLSSGDTTPSDSLHSTTSTTPTLVSNYEPSINGASDPLQKPVVDLATPLSIIPVASSGSSSLSISQSSPASSSSLRIVDILRTAIRFSGARSWVLISPSEIIPPHKLRFLAEWHDPNDRLCDLPSPVSVEKKDWSYINKDQTLHDAQRLLSGSTGDHNTTATTTTTNPVSENTARDNKNDMNTARKRDSDGNEKSTMRGNRVIAVVGASDGDVLGVIQEEDIWHNDKL